MKKYILIQILGCGTSSGIPSITGYSGNCNINNAKNKRTRTSAVIKYKNTNILIDTSPDLRFQLLRENIKSINYVLYTHEHADHFLGINELNYMRFNIKKPIEIYCTKIVAKQIEMFFYYLIKTNTIKINIIKDFSTIQILNLKINTFLQNHGTIDTMSYIFNINNKNFCYTTDVFYIEKSKLEKIKNIDLWIVSCVSIQDPLKNHAGLNKILQWQKTVNAKKIILTHMGPNMDYHEVNKYLEKNNIKNIELAYDRMSINL